MILALMLVICFSAAAFAEDEAEATPIDSSGLYYYESFTADDTVKLYSFSLKHSAAFSMVISDFTCDRIDFSVKNLDEDWTFLNGSITTSPYINDDGWAMDAGNYQLEIKLGKGDPCPFTFFVNCKPTDETYSQPNGSIAQARDLPALPLNKDVTGCFSRKNNCDVYKFELEKSGRFTVKWGDEDNDIFYSWLQLYDFDENVLFSKMYHVPRVVDNGETMTLDLEAGTYYLKWTDQSSPRHQGSYHFKPVFKASG